MKNASRTYETITRDVNSDLYYQSSRRGKRVWLTKKLKEIMAKIFLNFVSNKIPEI